MVVLQADKVYIKKIFKYFNYAKFFCFNYAIQLLEYNNINNYTINKVKIINYFIKQFVFKS